MFVLLALTLFFFVLSLFTPDPADWGSIVLSVIFGFMYALGTVLGVLI